MTQIELTRTDIINKAIQKLGGGTSSGISLVDTITGAMFIDPSTATTATMKTFATFYPIILKELLSDVRIAWSFATQWADLGDELEDGDDGFITEIADWTYQFNLPSLFRPDLVIGSDSKTYRCSASHTSATATNKPVTGTDYDDFWALFSSSATDGAAWANTTAYIAGAVFPYIRLLKQTDEDDRTAEFDCQEVTNADQSGKILLTNDYSNSDGDSAYIEYIAYVDAPILYPPLFVDAFATLLASMFAAEMKDLNASFDLKEYYEKVILPAALAENQKKIYKAATPTWFERRVSG